jgi:hypothetical protein
MEAESSKIVDRVLVALHSARPNDDHVTNRAAPTAPVKLRGTAPASFCSLLFWRVWRRWKLFRIRSSRAGGTQENLVAIGERDITRVRPLFGMIACLVAVNYDVGSRRKRGFIDPAPKQRIGAAALKHPDFLCAVRLSSFNMDPGMRIDPFYFYDLALDQNRAIRIKFGSKRMMRYRWSRSDQ